MNDNDENIAIPSDDEVARYGSEKQADAEASSAEQPSELERLKTEVAEYKDKLLRAQAECSNISKRLTQQHAASLKMAGMDMARAMLVVLDSFDRVMETIADAPKDDPIAQGVRLIYDQFRNAMESQGIKPMISVGETFDPACHEAMMQDRQSELPPGTITIEMQRGYMMGDRVLRHAKVAVAAAKEDAEEGSSQDEQSED